jgi:cytochrome P450
VPASPAADGCEPLAEYIRIYGAAIGSCHPAPGGLEERVEQVAPQFRAHIEAAIRAHRDGSAAAWPASAALPPERTVLGQLLARAPFSDGDAGIVRSVTGMLAASASFPKVFASVLHELLERPEHMRAFAAAVLAQDKPRALGYVREALRQRPPFPVLVRACPNAAKLGDAEFASGSVVPFFPLAAMFDPSLEPPPDVFDPQRPESHYFLFGGAPRECIGKPLMLELFLPMFEALFRHVPGVLDAVPGEFSYDGPVLDHYRVAVNASAFASAIPATCPMHRANADRASTPSPAPDSAE